VDRGRGDDQQAEEREQDEQGHGDDGADAGGERGADPPADQPAGAGDSPLRIGRVAHDLGDAEHRGEGAEPADRQPSACLRARAATEQPQRGEEEDDRQHHDQRADDPAHSLGQADTDRADPVAPGGRTQDDRQPQHGQADAVAAVLGGERLGLLRAGDGPGEATGAAGEQPPPAGDDTPETG
jgi:hypothetical protein